MLLRRRTLLFAFVGAVGWMAFGGAATAQTFDHKGLARLVLENHIRPGYEKLVGAADAFVDETRSFCAGTPKNPPDALKDAYRNLVLTWARIEHVRFGPVADERRHARMFYWPDRKGLGKRQVHRSLAQRDVRSLDVAALAERSVALQGLGAAEILLYGKGADEFEQAGEKRDYRCGYLQAIAMNLSNVARDTRSGWEDENGFPAIFLAPGPDNPSYLDESEVTLEIAKAFLVGLERLRDIEIAGPLGLSRKTARRTRAAFEPSGLSSELLAAKLEGMTMLFVASGLQDRIEAHEAGMGKSVLAELKQALAHLSSVKEPMSAVPVNREAEDRFLASGFPLKNAREQTRRVLGKAAGLSLGFNALDGD